MNSPFQVAPISRGPSRFAYAGDVSASGCKLGDWLACAGVVASCAVACCGGACLASPTCIACLGGAYGTCSKCF